MRFFKRGPITVVRKALDVRDTLITDTDEKLQVGFESRAIRPWEEFDEGIIRWTLRAFVTAVAAQFSGVAIAINGAGPNFTTAQPVPVGSLLVIDEVKNTSVNVVRAYIGAAAAGLISAAPADFTDARWGPRQAIPPIQAVTGNNGAVSGDEIGYVGANERWQKDGLFMAVAEQAAAAIGGDQALTFFSDVVNVTLDLRIYGRVILPR